MMYGVLNERHVIGVTLLTSPTRAAEKRRITTSLHHPKFRARKWQKMKHAMDVLYLEHTGTQSNRD
jgi:hypothetical protein